MQIIRNSIETGTGPRQWFMARGLRRDLGPSRYRREYGAAPSIEEA